MFKYHISNGKVLLPVDDFSVIKKTTEIIDATSAKAHLEYPDGTIADLLITIDGVDITINKELIQNENGDYIIKEEA